MKKRDPVDDPDEKVPANKHKCLSSVTVEQPAKTYIDCLSPQNSSSEDTGGTQKHCNWGPCSRQLLANIVERK